MKWSNVKLIVSRELRDQLRDRRTLFTVVVMPMILYPLMGIAMLQVGQFMREYPTDVWIVGAQNLPDAPPLLIEDQINPQWLDAKDRGLLVVQSVDAEGNPLQEIIDQLPQGTDDVSIEELVHPMIQKGMQKRKVDIAVFVSPPASPRSSETDSSEDASTVAPVSPTPRPQPRITIFRNSVNDQSTIGATRFGNVLRRWQTAWIAGKLAENNVSPTLITGLDITHKDVAAKVKKRAALWSKILPFIVVIWALTGAFYPAIDLCAGEKERGTFETLLSSPAARSEIAIGKLLTVMSFSAATSLLNLLSMGFTGAFVVAKMGGGMMGNAMPIGFPPVACFFWLVVALIPISALFSAIALAAAAFARSSKEGQYYLVPLMMISMPLMMIPMLPAVKLELGTSLIPVSGLMLLLRGLIEGEYAQCLRFGLPVVAVTAIGCWAAIRWVIHQFNSETVLFRASERFSLDKWLQHVMRERHALPTVGNALLCGVLILITKFFIGFAVASPSSFLQFAQQTAIILVATVGVPAVIMALILTRDPRRALRLNPCTLPVASAAILMALFLNPLFTWLTALVMHLYPPGGNIMAMEQAISAIMSDAPGLWAILLVFALAPALIEEIAFRGFILSGMEALRTKWHAILLTSLLFGIAHAVIQQSIITFGVGVVLGILAIQSRSIIPCMLFHAVHNGLTVLLSFANPAVIESSPILSRVLVSEDGVHYQYGILPGILMAIIGLALVAWFLRLPASTQRIESEEPLPADPVRVATSGAQ